MHNQESDILEKIRKQFDDAPYPRTPLEQSPINDFQSLYIHNFVTAYYLRNQKIVETQGKVILDAGCGSGYKSLILAEANPGAKIIGIDLSEESVKLAQQRLLYHGFENTEFYALSIENLQSLGIEFDYINNDEVLYLLPDIVIGLQAMKSVLKPGGIIRSNLHSSIGRTGVFAAQKLFKMMGLMDENPRELEMEIASDMMTALKDEVWLKSRTWKPENAENEEWILMNYLFQGDKGYTIPEMFAALRGADLEFVSMVNWRHWELMDLFKSPEDLPAFLEMGLSEISAEQRLHMFELLHPVHRLLDFWCAHPNQTQSVVPVPEWSLSDWQQARVHLHPQLRTVQVKEDLIDCITRHKSWDISSYVKLPAQGQVLIESGMGACLLPLWEGGCHVKSIVERWLKLRPLDPVTLESVSQETAQNEVKELLIKLETFLYVLLELSA
jgi:2-polyprenyl-3-methyl-5-hydroxy-6-metoxy-1,4-benzoquinol methylase